MTLVARPLRAAGSERARAVEGAIVEAVAYADVFDWPLTPAEIHAFLPIQAGLDEVVAAVQSARLGEFVSTTLGQFTIPTLGQAMSKTDKQVTLVGREHLVAERARREAISAALWRRAHPWARRVAALPFVRLVAVTGSLAVGASADDADVDLLIVTEPGRLWLTRAMTVGLVRAAAARGVPLCPNYFLADSALELTDHDLFTAHELVQMVTLSGAHAQAALLERNGWYRDFLPNHPGPRAMEEGAPARRPHLRGLVERALLVGPVDRLERWEMKRKVARLGALARSSTTAGPDAPGPWSTTAGPDAPAPWNVAALPTEARFDAQVCKGHAGAHRRRSLAAYEQRLARLADRDSLTAFGRGGPGT
ncbi:MAG: hypothetical protein ACRDGL_02525 [Candidatus Limnocylindrales bacterium]